MIEIPLKRAWNWKNGYTSNYIIHIGTGEEVRKRGLGEKLKNQSKVVTKRKKKSFEIYPQNSIGFGTKIQSFDLFTCAFVCFEVYILSQPFK